MNERFLKVFKRYIPDEQSAAVMEQITGVLNIRSDTKSRIVTCDLAFGRIVPKKQLYHLASGIKEAYELEKVELYPRYPSALFCGSYVEALVETICSTDGRIGRGFFDGCESDFDENAQTVTIRLRDGVTAALLNSDGADAFFSQCVRYEFGRDVKFRILGELADMAEPQYVRDAKEEIGRAAEKYREQLAADASGAAPDVERSSAFSEMETPDFEYLNEENTLVRSGRLVFDISEPEAVMGVRSRTPLRPIKDIENDKNCAFLGRAFLEEERESRDYTKRTVKLYFTDLESSVITRFVVENTDQTNFSKVPAYYLVEGRASLDKFEGETVVRVKTLLRVKNVLKGDDHPTPRVELHLHTNMSAVDALCEPEQVLAYAERRNMPAIAVTDHGNVQAFPEIMNACKKHPGVKPLYGMEGYLVDDTARAVFGYRSGNATAFADTEFVVFDIETTGLSAKSCGITEIGAVIYKNGSVTDVFETYVNPGMPIPAAITRLTGIDDSTVAGAPDEKQAVSDFLSFADGRMLIAHNAGFDVSFIRRVAEQHGLKFSNPYLDTVSLSRYLNKTLKKHTLDTLGEFYRLGEFNHHRASDDTRMLAKIFGCMVARMESDGIKTIDEMLSAMAANADPKRLRTYHVTLLVRNRSGLRNLYRMISQSYLDYYYRHPRLPKTLIAENRDGLLIGSACESGELFRAIMDNRPDSELLKIADFYDYLEIMPKCNNQFLIDEGRLGSIRSPAKPSLSASTAR